MKFSSKPHATLFLAAAGLAFGAVPLSAAAQSRQDAPKSAEPAKEPERPITDRDVGAADVALTPLSDLNIKKGEIPQLLIDAQDDPYDLRGMTRCSQIAAAVSELDVILGEDLDVAQAKGQRVSAGRAAQAALGSFIPFRGLIREVSGANAQERKVQNAIYAGAARRAFLKGTGQQRGCRYPARSATAQTIAQLNAEAEAAQRAKEQLRQQPQSRNERRNDSRDVRTVSRPVVQSTR